MHQHAMFLYPTLTSITSANLTLTITHLSEKKNTTNTTTNQPSAKTNTTNTNTHQQNSLRTTASPYKTTNTNTYQLSTNLHPHQSTNPHDQCQRQHTHNNQLSTTRTNNQTAAAAARAVTMARMWDRFFPLLAPDTAEGAWAMQLIQLGTKSLVTQAATFDRMMTITGVADPLTVHPNHVLRYLQRSTSTCKPQTLDQYLGHILLCATRMNLHWANDRMWPFIRKGLRLTSTPRKHATPVTPQLFHDILLCLPPHLQLAASLAYLSGSRLDEIFRHTPQTYFFVPAS